MLEIYFHKIIDKLRFFKTSEDHYPWTIVGGPLSVTFSDIYMNKMEKDIVIASKYFNIKKSIFFIEGL